MTGTPPPEEATFEVARARVLNYPLYTQKTGLQTQNQPPPDDFIMGEESEERVVTVLA